MQASGFLDQKRHRHPVGLGVIVAGHAAVIAALMLAKGPGLPVPPKIIELINIRPAPPPDPADPPPAPDIKTKRESVTVPTTDISTKSQSDDFVIPPLPPGPPPGPLGTGNPIELAKPPVPIPVLTDAMLDTRFADQFQPPYPAGKQRLGEEGLAVLRVLIGTDGRVKKVERVSGDEAFLAVSERQALRRWRFKPATRDGVPVETWKRMTVRFEIS